MGVNILHTHHCCVYNNLRQKLDLMGYPQTLCRSSIPLVGAIFEDLVKTKENLADANGKIFALLEGKSAWESGVESCKCNNTRLLAERKEFEQRICELNKRIQNLEKDKKHLEQQCKQLQCEIKTLSSKLAASTSGIKQDKELGKVLHKKPFISTVRGCDQYPSCCSKRNGCNCQKRSRSTGGYALSPNSSGDIGKLERNFKDLTQEVEFYKRKMEAHDSEICRLKDLLPNSRPAAALGKDCCYKCWQTN